MSSPRQPRDPLTAAGTEQPGRRERKRTDNLRRIRTAALELFAEHGYDAVTMNEVADRADVSLSTLIRAVATKQDLLVGMAQPVRGQLIRAFAAQPPEMEPRQALADVVLDFTDKFPADDEWVRLWRVAMTGAPEAVRRMPLLSASEKEELSCLVARRMGVDKGALEAGIAVAVVVAACEHAFEHWLRSPTDQTIHEITAQALSLALGGEE